MNFSKGILLFAIVGLLPVSVALAQTSPPPTATAEPVARTTTGREGELRADGYRAGEKAAGKVPVWGRSLAGFVGGLPLGFFAPVALEGQGETLAPAGVGAAIIGGAAFLGSGLPPSQMDSALLRGEIFAKAFADGYEARLTSRRKKSAFIGGAAGTVAGFGLLIAFITALPY